MTAKRKSLGASAFISFVRDWGHPEWIVLAVKASLGKVGERYRRHIEAKEWLKNVPVRCSLPKHRLAGPAVLLELKGSDWTVIYDTVALPTGAFDKALAFAQALSRSLKTQTAVFVGEDTSSAMSLFQFKNGKKISERNWSSQVRARTTEFFAKIGLGIPPCYPVATKSQCYVAAPKEWIQIIGRVDLQGEKLTGPASKKGKRQLAEEPLEINLAAEKGLLSKLAQLLREGVSIEARRGDHLNSGFAPLHSAAARGQLKAVKFLVEAGSTVDMWVEDEFYRIKATPLTVACRNGHLRVAQYLISVDANVNANYPGPQVPITAAAQHGSVELVRYLLTKGAKIPPSALSILVSKVKANAVLELLKAGADPKFKDAIRGETVFMQACSADPHVQPWDEQSRIVDALLARGADVNEGSSAGLSPLMEAVSRRNVPLVEFLLDHGADVDAADDEGKTALHYSVLRGSVEIVKILLKAGANPNTISRRVEFPGAALDIALQARNKPLVDILLPVTKHKLKPVSLARMKRDVRMTKQEQE